MNIVSRHDAAGTMTVDQICTAIVYLVCFRQRLLGRNLNLVLYNEVKYFLRSYMAFLNFSGEQNWGERMFEKSKGIVVVYNT